MASFVSRLFQGMSKQEERAATNIVQMLTSWSSNSPDEPLPHDFVSYVTDGYKENGIVFSAILARMLLFSEAVPVFRRLKGENKGDFDHDHPGLDILRDASPVLLNRMEQDVSLGGNAFVYRPPRNARDGGDRLQRLRPDWTDIVGDSDTEQVVGFLFHKGGRGKAKPIVLLPDEVAHWAPIPDPLAKFRGMSWLTPVAREVDSDTLMTKHKGKFFDNAATPNMVLKVAGKMDPEVRKRLETRLKERHEGWENAYKTLLVEGAAEIDVVGNTFQEMSFSVVQAAGENRIAIASGVPGVVIGLKEGTAAATYSNYQQAMRRWVDVSMRPHWRGAFGALESIIVPPSGFGLWYDDADISALKQDKKDEAEIAKLKAETAGLLIRAGYEPDAAGQYAETGKGIATLPHTGNVPVTLYPNGMQEELKPSGGKQAPEDQGST